jgi:hypothetical protein
MKEGPIVFLDIDGVLDSYNWFKSRIRRIIYPKSATEIASYISRRNLFWVSLFCRITKAKVVLSSSWRYGWDENGNISASNKGRSVAPTDKLLRKWGINIISVTPKKSELKNTYDIDYDIIPDSYKSRDKKEVYIEYTRGAQILNWIEQHEYNKSFLIFEDDWHDIACFKCLEPHIVKCKFYGFCAGFSFRQFINALRKYKNGSR